jgi:hypothetical protein
LRVGSPGKSHWTSPCQRTGWTLVLLARKFKTTDRISQSETAHQVLWLIPLFMFLILLTGLVRMIWEQRTAIFALISIVGGGLSAYLMYSEQIGNGQFTGVAAVQMTLWFWLGLLACLLVVATALLFYATQGKPP